MLAVTHVFVDVFKNHLKGYYRRPYHPRGHIMLTNSTVICTRVFTWADLTGARDSRKKEITFVCSDLFYFIFLLEARVSSRAFETALPRSSSGEARICRALSGVASCTGCRERVPFLSLGYTIRTHQDIL